MRQFDLLREGRNLPKRHLRQGSYLYRAGDRCDNNIYIILEGKLGELDKNEAFKFGSDIGPGGIVGDIEIMAEAPERLQSWKAKTETTLGVMDKRVANLLGSQNPEFFLFLLKSSIDNLTRAERELVDKGKAGAPPT